MSVLSVGGEWGNPGRQVKQRESACLHLSYMFLSVVCSRLQTAVTHSLYLFLIKSGHGKSSPSPALKTNRDKGLLGFISRVLGSPSVYMINTFHLLIVISNIYALFKWVCV